ncbi:MAG TPA: hypothetical protein DFI01_08960 [Bacteroidales bacterium]|nr:hypothetical protein [Bacteroidales bacterium]
MWRNTRINKTFANCFYYRVLKKEDYKIQSINFQLVSASKEKKEMLLRKRLWAYLFLFVKSSFLLEIPYLILSSAYLYVHWGANEFNFRFWAEMLFANIWFVIGPILVHKFMDSFIGLNNKSEFNDSLRGWFVNSAEDNYRFYVILMHIFGTAFLVVALLPIIISPNILTDVVRITNGYHDIFFWFVIAFLGWFIIYCTNALSAIALVIRIIHHIKRDDVIQYQPLNEKHRITIKALYHFGNKTFAYMCSGILFLPLCEEFFNGVYTYWITGMIGFTSIFLLLAVIYPRIALKSYTREKEETFLLVEKNKYFQRVCSQKDFKQGNVVQEISNYNAYLYLQELKTVCSMRIGIGFHEILTYATSIVGLLCSLPGLTWLFRWILKVQ